MKKSTLSKERGALSIETSFVLIIAFYAISSLGGLTQSFNDAANEIATASQRVMGGGTEQTMGYTGVVGDRTNSDGGGSSSSAP